MSKPRKPKFRVGMIVCVRTGSKDIVTGRDLWYPVRITAMPVPSAGWGYQLTGLHGTTDAPERDLRLQTARERGGR